MTGVPAQRPGVIRERPQPLSQTSCGHRQRRCTSTTLGGDGHGGTIARFGSSVPRPRTLMFDLIGSTWRSVTESTADLLLTIWAA